MTGSQSSSYWPEFGGICNEEPENGPGDIVFRSDHRPIGVRLRSLLNR